MQYKFKAVEEAFWVIVVAVAFALAQALLTFEPEKITDWRTWAIALAGSLVRAAAGALLALRSKPPSVEA